MERVDTVWDRLVWSVAALFEERFLDRWFKVVGWSTLIATMAVFAERADSVVINALSLLSAVALGIHIYESLSCWFQWVIGPLHRRSNAKLVVGIASALLAPTLTFVLLLSLFDAIEVVLPGAAAHSME